MKIFGLQKLSLLDYPSGLCATIFTAGCNMRCPYCHNRDLVLGIGEAIPTPEIHSFLQSRQGKLDAVCISGGEPLLQNDIEGIIDYAKSLGYLVKLDTNGSHPDRLAKLICKLDYIAMDIKNSLDKYTITCGLEHFDSAAIQESIQLIRESAKDYAFRTTLVKELHSHEDMHAIGSLIQGARRYDLQNYETGPHILSDKKMHGFSAEELLQFQNIAKEYVENTVIKNG